MAPAFEDAEGDRYVNAVIRAALRHASYAILADDGSFYGEIPECNGVYANTAALEDCREQLAEVLEEWVFRVHQHLPCD